MKFAAITIAVLCLGAPQLPQSNPKPAKKATQEKQHATNLPNQTVAIYNQPSPAQDQGDDKKEEIAVERQLAKFTWYLVLVGGAQCLVLIGQGVLFLRQERIMEQQKTTLVELASSAKNNAAAAKDHIQLVIDKERARLWLEMPKKLNLSTDAPVFISYKAFYEGFTPAFNVSSEVNAVVSAEKDFPASGFKQKVFSLPNVVSNKSDLQPQYSNFILDFGGSLRLKLDGETLAKIGESQMFIHFWGAIRYRDIFDRGRETTFRYRWVPGKDERYDRWETYGNPEDNRQT